MSRTRRKDPMDVEPKRPDMVFFGTVFTRKPTKREVWRAHRDKKKRHKPGTKAKAYLHKGRRARLDQEIRETKDFDNLPQPREPHSDQWNYN